MAEGHRPPVPEPTERATSRCVVFLPACLLGRRDVELLSAALRQVADLWGDGRDCSAAPPGQGGEGGEGVSEAGLLLRARAELLRHAGRRPEPCMLSKEAVFAIAGELSLAERSLARRGLHAAALVASSVAERLLDAVSELPQAGGPPSAAARPAR